MSSPRLRTVGLILFVALASARPALSQGGAKNFDAMMKHVPARANALMLIDADALFNSPLGRQENWLAEARNRSRAGLGLAPDVTHAVVAMDLDLASLEERGELTLLALRSGAVDLRRLAALEGGFVETVKNTQVVWTPRDFYIASLPPGLVGVVSPAERQKLADWLQMGGVNPRSSPPGFADRAILRNRAGSQIVLSVDLSDAISPQIAEPWLNTIEAVKAATIDPKLLAARLASAKSATLEVNVDRTITGTLWVDFGLPIDYAGAVAKDLVLQALDGYGALLPDMENWTAEVTGKTIQLTGRLSSESAGKILDIARPPGLTPEFESYATSKPAAPAAPTPPVAPSDTDMPPPTIEASKSDVVQASKQYFRAVADMLESLKRQKASTYSSMKIWYDKYAKQIEELPLLGVDKELLDWGSVVARTLREMGSGINYSAKNQSYTLAGRPNGYGGAYYGGYGYYAAESKSYDQAVIKRQSDAAMSVSLDSRWQVLETSISDMRRKMVEKYQVDF